MPSPPPILFAAVYLLVFFFVVGVPPFDNDIPALGLIFVVHSAWIFAIMRKTDTLAGRKPKLLSFYSSFGRSIWLTALALAVGFSSQLDCIREFLDVPITDEFDDLQFYWMASGGFIWFVSLDMNASDFCEVELASTQIRRSRFVTLFCFMAPMYGVFYIHYRLAGMQALDAGS